MANIPSDPTLLTLSDAADLVAARKLSSRELVAATLSRIEMSREKLNAFISLDPDRALAQAEMADEILSRSGARSRIHGIPLAHKDMFYRSGRPSTGSSSIRREFVPSYTASVLQRLDGAVAIELGTLMLQEFCLGASGTDKHYGQCHNPWSSKHIPGGSSGGSGVAVAARLVFGSLGSDTNGSIRIPSSVNGIVGLRPTLGRVSRFGAMPLSASMDTIGPLARTARDVARLLTVVAGTDVRDPTSASIQAIDYESTLENPIRRRKIGLLLSTVDEQLDDEVRDQIEGASSVFRRLGCEVRPVAFPMRADCDDLGNIIVKSEGAGSHRNWLSSRAHEYARQARGRLEAGLMIPAAVYWQAMGLRKHMLHQFMTEVMKDLDAVLMPVVPTLVPTIEDLEGGDLEQALDLTVQLTKFNRPIGYLGLPSICVPAGKAGGLPTSFQLVGRPFAEAQLLNFAHLFLRETEFDRDCPPGV